MCHSSNSSVTISHLTRSWRRIEYFYPLSPSLPILPKSIFQTFYFWVWPSLAAPLSRWAYSGFSPDEYLWMSFLYGIFLCLFWAGVACIWVVFVNAVTLVPVLDSPSVTLWCIWQALIWLAALTQLLGVRRDRILSVFLETKCLSKVLVVLTL